MLNQHGVSISGDAVLFFWNKELKKPVLNAIGDKFKSKSPESSSSCSSNKGFVKHGQHQFNGTSNLTHINIDNRFFHKKSFHTHLALIVHHADVKETSHTTESTSFLRESFGNHICIETTAFSHVIHHGNYEKQKNGNVEVGSSSPSNNLTSNSSPKNSTIDRITKTPIQSRRSSFSVLPPVTNLNLRSSPQSTSGSQTPSQRNLYKKSQSLSFYSMHDIKRMTNSKKIRSLVKKEQDLIREKKLGLFAPNMRINHANNSDNKGDTRFYDFQSSHTGRELVDILACEKNFFVNICPELCFSINFIPSNLLKFIIENERLKYIKADFWKEVLDLLNCGICLDDSLIYNDLHSSPHLDHRKKEVLSDGIYITTPIYETNQIVPVNLQFYSIEKNNENIQSYMLNNLTTKDDDEDEIYKTMSFSEHDIKNNGERNGPYKNGRKSSNVRKKDKKIRSKVEGGDGVIIQDYSDNENDEDSKIEEEGGEEEEEENVDANDYTDYGSSEKNYLEYIFEMSNNFLNRSTLFEIEDRPKSPIFYIMFIDLEQEIIDAKTFSAYLELITHWIVHDSLPQKFLFSLNDTINFFNTNDDHNIYNENDDAEDVDFNKKTKKHMSNMIQILKKMKANFLRQNKTFLIIVGHSRQQIAINQIEEINKFINDKDNEMHTIEVNTPRQKNTSQEPVKNVKINKGSDDDKTDTNTSPISSANNSESDTTISYEIDGKVSSKQREFTNPPANLDFKTMTLETNIAAISETAKKVFGKDFLFLNIDCHKPSQILMMLQKMISLTVIQNFGKSVVNSSGRPYGISKPSDRLLDIIKIVYQ